MAKLQQTRSKSRDDLPKLVEDQDMPSEVKYLSRDTLPIYTSFSGTHRSAVPPMSPKELIFDYYYTRLPRSLPKLKNLKLPYVRDIGIRGCVDRLADHFRCTDYKFNLIQFWFLDVLTDCLWRAQDEYNFPEKHQKIVLEWMLFVFNLIRAPEYNISRKKVFKLFKEAMVVAENYIQTGCAMVPLPDELFTLNLEGDKEESESDTESDSNSSESTISLESDPGQSSYLAIKFQGNTEYFKLPENSCIWNVENECLSSSEETMSEEEKPPERRSQSSKPAETEAVTEEVMDEETEFYKPDLRTPPRFKASHTSLVDSDTISSESSSEKASEESGDAVWRNIPRRPSCKPCSSEYQVSWQYKTKENVLAPEQQHDEEVLQAWYEYYLWQKRMKDMNNADIGWATYPEDNAKKKSTESVSTNGPGQTKKAWMDYIKERGDDFKKIEENVFINTCVLMAIKQFVFDYFYESFQYTLMRIAYRCHHHLITQTVNDSWHIPKIMRSELKRPKPKKQKKEKVPKEKKPKKEKPPKKPKEKAEKKSKPPKSPKEKKEKPKQLTKEEKAELARFKREQEMAEEKKRIAEMNKRFMFPLSEAANDAFYEEIFENWVRIGKEPKGKKQKGK